MDFRPPGRAAAPRVYAVAELDREIRFLLEEAYRDVWVEGELSNVRPASTGHVYFRLCDPNAALDCVLFRSNARRLRFPLADGQRVRCRGQLTLYEPQGKFQLVVSRVETGGAGELLARVEALKTKLAAEGLFDEARKRPLPRLPRRVGVVSSATGAAIQDVIQVATRRFPVRLLVCHAAVQGDTAPMEIAFAIRALARVPDVDVVLVTRGGGSVEDLMAFNDERVVRAIAACRVPVVSAVGHEVDVTLSDLVADVRAPTPSAAAELIVPHRSLLDRALESPRHRIVASTERRLRDERRTLDALVRELTDPGRAIAAERQRLDGLVEEAERALRRARDGGRGRAAALTRRLERLHPRARLLGDRARLARAVQRARGAVQRRLAAGRVKNERADSALGALSPVAVLGRGYSIALHVPTGRALRDPASAQAGDALDIVVEHGRVRARVE